MLKKGTKIMLFKNITILDENLEIKNNMYVVTEADRIKYIGGLLWKENF